MSKGSVGGPPGLWGGGSLSAPDRWTQLCPDSSRRSRTISLRIETRSLGRTQVPFLPLFLRDLLGPHQPSTSSPAASPPRIRVVVFRPAGPWGARGHQSPRERGERPPKGPPWTFAREGGEAERILTFPGACSGSSSTVSASSYPSIHV